MFVRSVPPLQTASRRSFSLQCKCKPRDIQTIQCVNILCKAVNNHLSNQSGHDTRIWYHKTAAIKECPQAPFLSFSPPYPAIFLFALYPTWSLFTGYFKASKNSDPHHLKSSKTGYFTPDYKRLKNSDPP